MKIQPGIPQIIREGRLGLENFTVLERMDSQKKYGVQLAQLMSLCICIVAAIHSVMIHFWQ